MVNISKVKRLSNPAIMAARYHLEKEHALSADYKVSSEVLGQGLCGSVVVVHGQKNDKRYALKTLRKEGAVDSKQLQYVAEVEIHLSMDHPNIAHVKDVYESESSISMVTECCEGGELYSALEEKGTYGDVAAAEAARQMLQVVRHLHARSIVHRDLKLENFLYQEKNPHAQMDKFVAGLQENSDGTGKLAEAPQLKLIDFGFARVWDPSRRMTTACGSAEYVSPDVLCGEGYTDKTDLWSVAVIVWMLLTGYPPFHGSKNVMMSKIKCARPDWSHSSRWNKVSQEAKNFVQKLLVKDPTQRLSAEEALQHPWFTSSLRKVECPLSCDAAVWSMQRYAAGSKLRRAALQVFAQQLDWKETEKFRAAFFSMDQNSSGWISVQDFQGVMEQWEQTSNESPFQHGDLQTPDQLFAALDANGDKRIYYSEFMAATVNVCRHDHEDALQATFARLDADSSGSIGIDDLIATVGATFEGSDVAELLYEGAELHFEDFAEAITLCPSADEVDVISPSKGRGFGLLSTFVTV